MEKINDAIGWYQKKIGTYDTLLWERSAEQTVLKRIHDAPKKPANVKSELIDVDLVRGSTFTKVKPLHGVWVVARSGLLRVIFMPLFYNYWAKQTSKWACLAIMALYVAQVGTMIVFMTDKSGSLNNETISLAHILSPIVMMLALGLTHSQIVANQISSKYRQERHKKKREAKESKKKILKKYESDSKTPKKHGKKSHHQNDHSKSSSVRQRKPKVFYRKKSGTSILEMAIGRMPWLWRPSTKKLVRVGEIQDADDEAEGKVNSRFDIPKVRISEEPTEPAADGQNEAAIQKVVEVVPNGSVPCASDHVTFHSEDGTVQAYSGDTIQSLSQPVTEYCGQLLAPESDELVKAGILNHTQADVLHRKTSELVEQLPSDRAPGPGNKVQQLRNPKGEEHYSDSGLNSFCEDNDISNAVADISARQSTSHGNSQNCSTSPKKSKHSEASHTLADSPSADDNLVSAKLVSATIEDEDELSSLSTHQSDKDSLSDKEKPTKRPSMLLLLEERGKLRKESTPSELSSCESDGAASRTPSSPKAVTSEGDWDDPINTELTSCSGTDMSCTTESDLSSKEEQSEANLSDDNFPLSVHGVNSVMNNLASSTDKVSCMIFEDEEAHKADLTVLDIGWLIIRKVEKIPETCDYLAIGLVFSLLLMLSPVLFRLYHTKDQVQEIDLFTLEGMFLLCQLACGESWRKVVLILNGCIQRFAMSFFFFFLLSVAERTFKQRLLYAKHFCYLTSFRRAKKYELPHFRLNKVRNIKTWLSLRSYLKKRGPQRSVDIIVSAAFIMAIFLVSVMCVELLQDFGTFLDHLGNLELVVWCMALSIYLLRFMTLGTKINKKYRNFSVLITEQINLYLHMEQKPHKKDELMLANSVLKLAEDLLKELESPFKISGLSANPFLYNITKVVILSAFSAVLTELLGFKLKLYKIKLRS